MCFQCGSPEECAGCEKTFVHRVTPGSVYCVDCACVVGGSKEWKKSVREHDEYMQLPRMGGGRE